MLQLWKIRSHTPKLSLTTATGKLQWGACKGQQPSRTSVSPLNVIIAAVKSEASYVRRKIGEREVDYHVKFRFISIPFERRSNQRYERSGEKKVYFEAVTSFQHKLAKPTWRPLTISTQRVHVYECQLGEFHFTSGRKLRNR